MAVLLYSNLMNALGVDQIMDQDITGNENAREWMRAFFSYAIEAKFRHREHCDTDITRIKEWRVRLNQLQDRDRVRDDDEEAEVLSLQGQIDQAMKRVQNHWKGKILGPWKERFLRSVTIKLELDDVPICSAFGASVKPRRAAGTIEEVFDNDEDPFPSFDDGNTTRLDLCDREEWDEDENTLLMDKKCEWERRGEGKIR